MRGEKQWEESRRRMAAKLRTGTQLAELRVSCLCKLKKCAKIVRCYVNIASARCQLTLLTDGSGR